MPARQLLASALLASLAIPLAAAQEAKGVGVTQAYAVATMPGAPTGVVYLSLHNRARGPDQLVGASTPRAQRVELHATSMTGDVMRMREVAAIDLAPGAPLRMRPGSGHHLMLVGLAAPLTAGEQFALTLRFRAAGSIEVKVRVEPATRGVPEGRERHNH
jgi:copper(I)-binding protein